MTTSNPYKASANNQNKRQRNDNANTSNTNLDSSSLALMTNLSTNGLCAQRPLSPTILLSQEAPSTSSFATNKNRDSENNTNPSVSFADLPANPSTSTKTYVKPTEEKNIKENTVKLAQATFKD